MRLPCWLVGHRWTRRLNDGVLLEFGTERERMVMIVGCEKCPAMRVSGGDYPPRRMPSAPPGMVPKPAGWPEAPR